jgi:hypothetical protein
MTHPSLTRGIVSPTGAGAQITGRVPFGRGSTRGQVFINPPGAVTNFGLHQAATAFGFRRQLIAPVFPFGPLTFVGGTSPFYSYERDAIIARLDDLQARRAGLEARWRVLEDEARRAGALPGWLRP